MEGAANFTLFNHQIPRPYVYAAAGLALAGALAGCSRNGNTAAALPAETVTVTPTPPAAPPTTEAPAAPEAPAPAAPQIGSDYQYGISQMKRGSRGPAIVQLKSDLAAIKCQVGPQDGPDANFLDDATWLGANAFQVHTNILTSDGKLTQRGLNGTLSVGPITVKKLQAYKADGNQDCGASALGYKPQAAPAPTADIYRNPAAGPDCNFVQKDRPAGCSTPAPAPSATAKPWWQQ